MTSFQTLLGITDLSGDYINANDITAITAIISGTLTTGGLITSGIYTVNNKMSVSQINAIIANNAYNNILFAPGTYNLTSNLLISRNKITLDGQNGATLTLTAAANRPNILVGDITASLPVTFYSDIRICNFIINGAKATQTSEFPTGIPGWVVNNCISVGYSSVVIDNCDLQQSISGGTTFTEQCNNCVISNTRSSGHTYDSYTAYGSTNLQFCSCYSTNNPNGAGISIDTGCQYVSIMNNCFTNNKLALFIRWSSDFTITGNILSGNAQQGMFIAGNYDSGNIGPNLRFTISCNTISNNGSQGVYLQSCKYFIVGNNTICNNSGNGINIAADNATYGLCSFNNFTGNVSSSNTGGGAVGFYNDASNSYSAGARSNYLSLNIVKNNTAGQIVGNLTAYTWDDDIQLNTSQLILHNSSGNAATVNPSGSGNCTWTFPASIGANNNLLTTDGSGNASWTSTPSVSDIVINNSGHSVTLYANSTGTCNFQFPPNGGTNGYLLQTDGSGNTSWTGTPSINTLQINNSGHSVTLYANSTGTCNFQFPANGGTNGYLLSTDGFGNTSWALPPSVASSAAVGAYYNSSTTLTLSGVSQNIPGLSASITLPSSGNYHIRADYVVNLEGITLNANVYCFAAGGLGIGAGTGAYIQAFTPPASTYFCANVLNGSGFLNNFGAGVVGISPYTFTGGSTVTVTVRIYTSSRLATSVTYYTGESDATGGYLVGSNLVLSCVPV